MADELSKRAQQLLRTFYKDDRNEGDINDYSAAVIGEVLTAGLLTICACSRPFKNAKLTKRGADAAAKL